MPSNGPGSRDEKRWEGWKQDNRCKKTNIDSCFLTLRISSTTTCIINYYYYYYYYYYYF